MNSKIVETLGLMCSKEDPQDRKILLLAELVETKCDALGKTQEELKKSLDTTNDKLDRLTTLLEKYERDTHSCPVYIHKTDYEKLSLFMRYPKISVLVLLGVMALLGGFFGAEFMEVLRKIFKL